MQKELFRLRCMFLRLLIGLQAAHQTCKVLAFEHTSLRSAYSYPASSYTTSTAEAAGRDAGGRPGASVEVAGQSRRPEVPEAPEGSAARPGRTVQVISSEEAGAALNAALSTYGDDVKVCFQQRFLASILFGWLYCRIWQPQVICSRRATDVTRRLQTSLSCRQIPRIACRLAQQSHAYSMDEWM